MNLEFQAVTLTVPAIYAPLNRDPRLSLPLRLLAAGVALGCAVVLGVAAWLPPSPQGVGTHTALGLSQCDFLRRSNIPCLGCGMTTSFSFFARGNLPASVWVQPMGAVLAVLTVAGFWVGLYISFTGRPALRLLRRLPPRYYLLPLLFFALASWGWKIMIHLYGIDGWS